MRLAIFGATGTVGRVLLEMALQSGHEVRALVRDPDKVPARPMHLTVVRGDASQLSDVAPIVAGCDGVLSTLGGFRGPESLSLGTAAVTTAMIHHGARRLVVMQGFHLHVPGDPHNLGQRLIAPIMWLASRDIVTHSKQMATDLRAADVDWTLVRAPRVVAGPVGIYRTGRLRMGPWSTVTDHAVADFMLACLTDPATIGRAPMIGTRRIRAARTVAMAAASADHL
jgi:putative NADH-flavin reductase